MKAYTVLLLGFHLLCTAGSKCREQCKLGQQRVSPDRCKCVDCTDGYYRSKGYYQCQPCRNCLSENNLCEISACNATANTECRCCPGYQPTSQQDEILDGKCQKITVSTPQKETPRISLPKSTNTPPFSDVLAVTTTISVTISPSRSQLVSHISSISKLSLVSVTSLAPKKALVSDVSTKPLPSNPTTITTATSESHQGGQSFTSTVVVIGVTLGGTIVVIAVVVVFLAIRVKRKSPKSIRSIQDPEVETSRLIIQDMSSHQQQEVGHYNESIEEILAVSGEANVAITNGTGSCAFSPNKPVSSEPITNDCETQESSDSLPPLNATEPTSCATDTGLFKYVRDLPERTKHRIGVVISDHQSNQCTYEVLGEILRLTKEEILELKVYLHSQGPVGSKFFKFVERRNNALTVDDLCNIVRSLGRPDLADDIRMWIKEDNTLIEGGIPDSECIIQHPTT